VDDIADSVMSIVLPTRKRPLRFKSFMDSVIEMATYPENLEFLVYVDDDDAESIGVTEEYKHLNVKLFTGERMQGLMAVQNFLYTKSSGDIIGYLSDDTRLLTKGWDVKIRQSFPADMIALVCPYERHKGFKKATHGFLSRRAVEAVSTAECGHFVPGCFTSCFSDQWLHEVYLAVGRFVPLRTVEISHDHPGFSKKRRNPDLALAKYWDEVYLQKNTPQKFYADERRFKRTAHVRAEWVEKLLSACIGEDNEQ